MTIEVVSTRSTGFRTNKRYDILLEFLGDLCLKISFCLLVIPFSSAINVISMRNAACAGINKSLAKGNRILQLRLNYLARSEHVLL